MALSAAGAAHCWLQQAGWPRPPEKQAPTATFAVILLFAMATPSSARKLKDTRPRLILSRGRFALNVPGHLWLTSVFSLVHALNPKLAALPQGKKWADAPKVAPPGTLRVGQVTMAPMLAPLWDGTQLQKLGIFGVMALHIALLTSTMPLPEAYESHKAFSATNSTRMQNTHANKAAEQVCSP